MKINKLKVTENLKKNMFDTNYALKDYLNEMTVEQLAAFGLSLFAGAMRSDLFMTEENYLMFSWDLGRLIGNVGALHGPLDNVSKKDLIDIYLKYIDLNVILADNVAESILSGADLEEVVKYIIQSGNSIRDAAEHFGISKSSVQRLIKKYDGEDKEKVENILKRNVEESRFKEKHGIQY